MSSFFSRMAKSSSSGTSSSGASSSAKGGNGKQRSVSSNRPRHMQIVETSYVSKPVDIAPEFLTTAPSDAQQPILTYPVDFSNTTLREYRGLYAIVLDNVLSPSECKQLIAYAEQSTGATADVDTDATSTGESQEKEAGEEGSTEKVANNGWKPAMVNAGPGREVLMTEYRSSDRIIWDNQEVVDRLWERCLQADGIREQLARIENRPFMQGEKAAQRGEKWHVTRLNERMRFLKYGPGQFFKEHCDGAYQTPGRDPEERSFVTLHLYLNDSVQAVTPVKSESTTTMSFPPPLPIPASSAPEPITLQGGATAFHSPDMKRRLDVDPKVGRVLLFQHKGLLHSGDYVTAGVKYTMRTDLMYEQELPSSA